jgi:hypothetical protein
MNLRVVLSVVAMLGAAAPSLASLPLCSVSCSGTQYKFSKAALGKVLDKARYVRDGEEYYDIGKAAKLLAPTWCEVFNDWRMKDTPPLLFFSRSDEIGRTVGNECLYAASSGSICSGGTEPRCGPDGNGNCCSSPKVCGWDNSQYTTSEYTRAYFHPGMGPWQLDTITVQLQELAAFEAVEPETAVKSAMKLGNWKGEGPRQWWGSWVACGGGWESCCAQVYNQIYQPDCLNVCADESVTELGGMVKWRCVWEQTPIDCYLLHPDLAEGSKPPIGRTGNQTPVPAVMTRKGFERPWPFRSSTSRTQPEITNTASG